MFEIVMLENFVASTLAGKIVYIELFWWMVPAF